MPAGEFIGEVILRPVLEWVICGLSYLTGLVFLKSVTLGRIRLAPLETIYRKNPEKRKWYQIDWHPWLHLPGKHPALKAESTCLVGFSIWLALGLAAYLGTRVDTDTGDRARGSAPVATGTGGRKM